MNNLLAILCVFVAPVAGSLNTHANHSVVVVERMSPKKEIIIRRAAETSELLTQELRANKYALVVDGSTDYYFADDLWQQESMDRVLKQYSLLTTEKREDWSVDFNKDPDLLSTAQIAAGMFGLQFDSSSSAQLEVTRNFTMQANGKSFSLTGTSRSKESAPPKALPALDHSKKPNGQMMGVDTDDHLVFYCYGPRNSDRDFQREEYKQACSLLGGHFTQYLRKKGLLGNALVNSLCGYDMQDFLGKGFDALPSEVQSQLKSAAAGMYAQIGFNSRAEAIAWVSQATLTGVNSFVGVTLGRTSGNMSVATVIP